MNVNYHILAQTIVINYNGKVIKAEIDSAIGQQVLDLIRKNNLSMIPNVIDNEIKISKYSNEKFAIVDGEVFSYGKKVNPIITEKIIQFHANNLPFEYLLNFWNNLSLNDSEDAQIDLYSFLESGEYPLTPDGYIIAYKRISKDFLDIWSRTIDNSIGAMPSMPRDQVCADRNITCAAGLHIASYDYAKHVYYGGDPNTLMIEVKVHPRDIVSVPIDYNHSKARTCGYEVISVIDQEHSVIILSGDKYISEDFKDKMKEFEQAPDNVNTVADQPIPMPDENNQQFTKVVKIGNDQYKSYKYIGMVEDYFQSQLLVGGYERRKPSKQPLALQECFYNEDVYLVDLYTRNYDNIGKVYFAKYVDRYGTGTNKQTHYVIFKKNM